MSDDIPFDKNFDLVPGCVDQVVPAVRRIMCNNPGPMTFKGTVSYIVGMGQVAIIDPGPLDEAHIAALLDPGGGAARWRHERLHGLARKTRAPHRDGLFPRPRRCGA